MKSVRFFLYLLVLGFFSFLFVLRLAFDSWEAYGSALLDMESYLVHSGRHLRRYFVHADLWNWLGLVALVSTLLIVFTLLDFMLRKWLLRKGVATWRDHFRWLGVKLASFTLTGATFVFFSNYLVMYYAMPRIVYDTASFNRQAEVDMIVLGTRKFMDNRSLNVYYEARMEAATALYKTGMIRRVIVSGDRRDDTYDEPRCMRQDLIQRGIPSAVIVMDKAGFRTLDSVVRLKNEFGFSRAVFVSQGFHLQRALFLAWYFSIDAYGFNSEGRLTGKMAARELLAKPKLLLDLFILNTQPTEGHTDMRRAWRLEGDDLILFGFTLALLFVALYFSFLAFE